MALHTRLLSGEAQAKKVGVPSRQDYSPKLHAGENRLVSVLTIAGEGYMRLTIVAVANLGDSGTIDTLGLTGYYTMLAMLMNTTRTPLPDGVKPALTPFPR